MTREGDRDVAEKWAEEEKRLLEKLLDEAAGREHLAEEAE